MTSPMSAVTEHTTSYQVEECGALENVTVEICMGHLADCTKPPAAVVLWNMYAMFFNPGRNRSVWANANFC